MTDEKSSSTDYPYKMVSRKVEERVLSVPDVDGMSGVSMQDLAAGLSRTIRQRGHRSVFIRRGKEGITVDVAVALRYGCHLEKTGEALQEAVWQVLEEVSPEPVAAVNVMVTRLVVDRG